MQVGFIGLGRMGSPIAANLLAAGHELTVGAQLAETPGDAARGDVVITMLADDHAVDHAVFAKDGILAVLAPGAIHVSMSTISVALSERLDAPISDEELAAIAINGTSVNAQAH
jgi:3-hydroxyisobutyrate dehydrogenase-like beta-hydroxyacid dehydrogenase